MWVYLPMTGLLKTEVLLMEKISFNYKELHDNFAQYLLERNIY